MRETRIKVALMDAMTGDISEGIWFENPESVENIDNYWDRDVYYETYVVEEVEGFPFEVNKSEDVDKIMQDLYNHQYDMN